MNISFHKKIIFIFILIVVVVFAFSINTYRNNKSLAANNYGLNQIQQVIYKTERVLSDLKDIETGVRGFAITRDNAFLAPFYQSKDSIITNIQKLASLTKDNPVQQLRIDTLYGLAIKRLEQCTMMSQIDFEESGYNDKLLVVLWEGKSVMDSIRKLISDIGGEESRLLLLREKINEENNEKLKTRFYILFGNMFLVFVLAFFIMRHNFSVLKRDNNALVQLNSKLKFLTKQVDEIIEGISDPFFALDKARKFIYLNTAAQAKFGYDKSYLIGKDIFEVFPGYKENIIGQNFLVVLRSQKAVSIEAYDGFLEYWQDLTIYPTAEGITVYIRDATGRKTNENELLKTKEFLEETNKVAFVGGWEFDIQKNNIYWTSETRSIHETGPGYVPDLKTDINFYKEGENRDTIMKLVNQGIQKGIGWDEELQIITAKGNERWIRTKGKAEFDNDNNCIRLYGSFQDIDDQKKMYYKLAQSEKQFRSAFEYSAIGMALVNPGGEWKEVNESLCNITGYSRSELLNLTFQEITHPDDLEIDLENLQELINEKRQSYKLEKRYYHKEGHIVWVLLAVSMVKDQSGKIIHFISQIQDITDIKEKEWELKNLNLSMNERNRELELKNEELEQFAYVASHDLQEPLRTISLFISKIEKKYGDLLDDEGKKYIHFAVDGASRMRQTIGDILDYSRIGGGASTKFTAIDLNILVKGIFQFYIVNGEYQNAVIEVGDLPVIRANETSMEQLFSNLISNAIKYQLPGNKPVIKIIADDYPDHWKFSITDNGIGIDPKSFQKVFNVFQRLHTKEQYSGTGIGLAICKKIVNNLKGEIWIDSIPGKGSTFYFTIMK